MDNELWAKFYRSDRANTKKIFIKAMTSDGEHHFFDTTTYCHHLRADLRGKVGFSIFTGHTLDGECRALAAVLATPFIPIRQTCLGQWTNTKSNKQRSSAEI